MTHLPTIGCGDEHSLPGPLMAEEARFPLNSIVGSFAITRMQRGPSSKLPRERRRIFMSSYGRQSGHGPAIYPPKVSWAAWTQIRVLFVDHSLGFDNFDSIEETASTPSIRVDGSIE